MTTNDARKDARNALKFFETIGKPPALPELFWFLSARATPAETAAAVADALASGTLEKDECFLRSRGSDLSAEARKRQDLLLDKKWRALRRAARWFRHIPFFDFALASGSMSFGSVRASSDFDVVAGVRAGRLFTARYLASALFSAFRMRRLDDLQASSPDMLCFNHFVTPAAYGKPPRNFYRRALYRAMVPLWCDESAFRAFASANAWSGLDEAALLDRRRDTRPKSAFARAIERLLGGKTGDALEALARRVAARRLAQYLKDKPKGGRVVVSDDELEFHFMLPWEERFKALD